MRQLFLVGDTSNRLNWGCRATSSMLRRLLEGVGQIRFALDTAQPSSPLSSRPSPDNRKYPTVSRGDDKSSTGTLLKNWIAPVLTRLAPHTAERYGSVLEHAKFSDYETLSKLIAN